jgi:putative peptidoglycan lipid II flippase
VLSAFPVLSARDGPVFDRTCAGSTRAVLLVTGLGMALTAAVSVPAAHVLAQQPGQVPELIQAFLLFAPGLAGMGVIANLSRVMLVIGRLKIAAVAVAASWLVGMAMQVVLAELVPARLVVAALALGQTIGQTAAAIPLIVLTRRIRGTAAIHGIGRAWLAGLGAAVAGGVVGAAVSLALPVNHKLLALGDGVLAAVVALVAFGLVGAMLDRGDMRAVMARAWSVVTLPRRSRQSA